jgi:hypothetical protein
MLFESPRERSPHKRPLPTSTRSAGFCVIWVCISSSSAWAQVFDEGYPGREGHKTTSDLRVASSFCCPESGKLFDWEWHPKAPAVRGVRNNRGPCRLIEREGPTHKRPCPLQPEALAFVSNGLARVRVNRRCMNRHRHRTALKTSSNFGVTARKLVLISLGHLECFCGSASATSPLHLEKTRPLFLEP